MPLDEVVSKVASPQLEKLDLTEAVLLKNKGVERIAQCAGNLKELNLSWCGGVGNEAVRMVVNNCLQLQKLVLNGLKDLNDEAFE